MIYKVQAEGMDPLDQGKLINRVKLARMRTEDPAVLIIKR